MAVVRHGPYFSRVALAFLFVVRSLEFAEGHQDNFIRAGLQRSGRSKGRRAAATVANDAAISLISSQRAQAHVASNLSTGTLSASPYQKLISMSATYHVAGPNPGDPVQTNQIGLVPYDMVMGAHIMLDLTTANSNQSTAPNQSATSQAYESLCPKVWAPNSSILITGPQCTGGPQGEWQANSTNMLHWQPHNGGISFIANTANLDSVVGSMMEKFTWSEYIFSFSDCLGVPAYTVEESVIKLKHTDGNDPITNDDVQAQASIVLNLQPNWDQAVYYQYTVRHPNGTTAAQTNLYSLADNTINITLVQKGDLALQPFAIATRVGSWSGSAWSDCTAGMRGWNVSFPNSTDPVGLVSVRDMRIAASALVTLLAFRDEAVAVDGFQHQGQGMLYWKLFRTIVIVFIGLLAAGSVCMWWQERGWLRISKHFFKRLEASMLPNRPLAERLPVLHPAW